MVNKFLYENGGSETYMMRLGEHLTSLGHQVEYFGMEHSDRCVGNSIDAYTETMDFHNAGAMQKLKLSLKTIYSKEARVKMLKVMEAFKPDVVHLNNFNFQLTPSIIMAVNDYEKKTGIRVKLVYTAHDYQLVCPNHMMNNPNTMENCEQCIGGNFISCTKGKCIHSSTLKSAIGTAEATYYAMKKTYSRIDTIICCSEFMKSKLDTNPIFKDKTITLHNFIQPIEKSENEKDDYVLYFGRYAFEKGIDTLIGAKGVKFICAGSGPIEEQVDAADNLTNVKFKKGKELADLISKAKCTVYPSIWYENCPFSVMESIMYGTPVVASRIGGIPELIDDGETGILVEPNDSKALEDAVRSILENDEKAKQMSKRCFEKKFDTVEDYTEKLLEIYKR